MEMLDSRRQWIAELYSELLKPKTVDRSSILRCCIAEDSGLLQFGEMLDS